MSFLKALSRFFSRKTPPPPLSADMCDVLTLTTQHYQDFDELYELLREYTRGRSDGTYFYSDTPYFYTEGDTFIFRAPAPEIKKSQVTDRPFVLPHGIHLSQMTQVWQYILHSTILDHFAAPLIVQRFFQPVALKKQYGRIPSLRLLSLLFEVDLVLFVHGWSHTDPRVIVGRPEIMPEATPFRFFTPDDKYAIDQFPLKPPKEEEPPVAESPSCTYDSKKEVDDVVKTTTQKSSTTVSAKPIKIIDDKDLRTNAATGIVHDGPVVATIVTTEQSILPTPHTTIVPCHRAVLEDCAAPMPDISNM